MYFTEEGTPWNWTLKVLKCKNEIYQQIEPKEQMKKKKKKKNRASCLVIMLTPGVMVIKMCKMAHFLCFLLMPAKISHSVDKIFTCIWKILNGSFRKCYRLLDSELPLARYQPWSFVIFFAEICFFDISTLHISRTVTLKPINHTIFGKNSKRSFRCT